MNQFNNLNNRVNHLIENSIQAQTDMWFTKRASMISATDFSVILGLGHGKTQNDLLQKKLYNTRTTDTVHTLHGKKFEPVAIEILEKRKNIQIKEIGFTISEKTPFLGATPDGITIEDGKIKLIEIKCPLTRQIDGCVPYGYYTQIQLQLYVCDVQECLFFECNLEEITKEKFEKLPDNICKGYNVANNCHWILHESNLVRVQRDNDFFNKYYGDLEKFHFQLKELNNNKKQNIRRSERKRKFNEIEEPKTYVRSNKRRKLNNNKIAKQSSFMLSTHHIKNYVKNNKCDAWLGIHGNKYYKEQKKVNQFSKQLSLRTKQLHKQYTDKLIKKCEMKNISYEIVPKYYGFNNFLNEMTIKYIENNVDVIINPMLSNNEQTKYSNPSYIINAKIINKLFPDNETKISFSRLQKNKYVVVNKVCKNLKYINEGREISNDAKHKHYISKNNFDVNLLNSTQNYNMNKSLIIGTKWNYTKDKKTITGLSDTKIAFFVHNLSQDEIEINKYKNWLNEIYENNDEFIFYNDKSYLPYYSKSENTDWTDFKKTILENEQDISLLYSIGGTKQKKLHKMGIYSWKDPKLPSILKNREDCIKLGINKRDSKIMQKIIHFNKTTNTPFICPNEIKNEGDWLHSDSVEFYVDFETINDFLGDINMIYLVGMYCKLPNGNYEYYSFFAEKADLESERKMMEEWIGKIEEIKRKYSLKYEPKVYCWSKAEQSFINAYNRRHSTNVKINLVDMLELIKKEIILIKGNIYGFSIKDVVKFMYEYNMISRNYKLDCSSGDLSIISAIKYYRNDDKKEYEDLIKYNETDCIVMYDIIKYFRKFYNQ